MTWVVGMTAPFGYAGGISDIRVTLANGEEHDCLQKIYRIGRFLALSFAGSVAIGFDMINRFTELLHTSDDLGAWDPEAVAEWFPGDAREVFGTFPEEERSLQSHLMLTGVHPNKHLGDSSWPQSYVYRFRSPHFESSLAERREVVGIGCGNAFQPCRDALLRISSDYRVMFDIVKGETGSPGGMAITLGIHLTFLLKKTQPRGISSRLHFCWVYRGRIVIRANDHVAVGKWTKFETSIKTPENKIETVELGQPQPNLESPFSEHFVMPSIASSWEQLEKLLQVKGVPATGDTA
jgi:hypothetical protein